MASSTGSARSRQKEEQGSASEPAASRTTGVISSEMTGQLQEIFDFQLKFAQQTIASVNQLAVATMSQVFAAQTKMMLDLILAVNTASVGKPSLGGPAEPAVKSKRIEDDLNAFTELTEKMTRDFGEAVKSEVRKHVDASRAVYGLNAQRQVDRVK